MQLAERRTQRSEIRAEALRMLLEACRVRAGLAALVVGDHDGLLVGASAKCAIDPNVVAAHLPKTYWRDQIPALHATTVKLGNTRLFVGAVGDVGNDWSREMLNAMRGLQRILAN